jgi:CPA2 family monovalent cation:H+ antiporter-2
VGITITLNVIAGQFVAWLNKLGPQAGINTAVILQNRGEFALILATLSAGAGLDERLQPFAGLYVLIMAVLGPVLAANSERIGGVVLRTRRRAEREAAEARRRERDARHSEEIALMEAALAGNAPGTSADGDAVTDEDDEEALLGARERAAADADAAAAAAVAAPDDYDDLDEQDRARATILAEQAGQQSDQRATRQRDPEY